MSTKSKEEGKKLSPTDIAGSQELMFLLEISSNEKSSFTDLVHALKENMTRAEVSKTEDRLFDYRDIDREWDDEKGCYIYVLANSGKWRVEQFQKYVAKEYKKEKKK